MTLKFSNVSRLRHRNLRMLIGLVCWVTPLCAEDEFEHAPISYYESESKDPVAELLRQVNDGTKALVADSNGDYLPSLLQVLDIPASSQCLVFSKTSLQLRSLARAPRARFTLTIRFTWELSKEVPLWN